MPTKQSDAATIRLIETGIRDIDNLASDKFYVLVRDVAVSGSPPSHIDASVLVRFLPSGAPFCCGEFDCYSRVSFRDGHEELGDYLRRKMNLRHKVTVQLNLSVEYFEGIVFTAFSHMNGRLRLTAELSPWPSKSEMAGILRADGLKVSVGHESICVDHCDYFVFQDYVGNPPEPSVDVYAGSLADMLRNAGRISRALAASRIRHRFKILDDNHQLVDYLHHDWPQTPVA